MRRVLWILVCLTATLQGQTEIDLQTQSKNVNFSGATATTPWRVGAVLPALCSVGQAFFNTTQPAGSNVFVCSSANQWTLASGGGSGSGGQNVLFTTGSGTPTGNCTSGQDLYIDITNQEVWFCENTNIWKKSLTTSNTGPFSLTGQNGAIPGAAPSGSTSFFFNSTAKIGQTVDDAGNLATLVRPADCSTSSQLVQKINSDGTVTCAAAGGGGNGTVAAVTHSFPSASGSSGAPRGLWWDDGGVGTVCDTGAAGVHCAYHWYSDSTTTHTAVITDSVPSGWSGGSVSFNLYFVGTGSTIQWSVASACQGNAAADPPAFNTAQNLNPVSTLVGNLYMTTVTGVTMAGCGARDAIYFRVKRVDTTGYVSLTGASAIYTIP